MTAQFGMVDRNVPSKVQELWYTHPPVIPWNASIQVLALPQVLATKWCDLVAELWDFELTRRVKS